MESLSTTHTSAIKASYPESDSFNLIGVDIGGTKCAISRWRDGKVEETFRVATDKFDSTFAQLCDALDLARDDRPPVIGVSCGGPLDPRTGTIGAPPNLPPSWHHTGICRLLGQRFNCKAFLMNDANACALAEWNFGAGRGTKHFVFLTSGTGFGAGLILNGQLYEGASGDAGEIGHVRLAPNGPIGYGKEGSVEGFCSGGGIARLAQMRLHGFSGPGFEIWQRQIEPMTAKHIAEAARTGDAFACSIMEEVGSRLGETLSILLDVFNPERIALGGFYPKCQDLLEPHLEPVLRKESLPATRAACHIVPAELGETIGSHGAISVALNALLTNGKM